MSRSALKRVIETVLAHGGPAALAARRRADSALILAYHNIVPDDATPVGECSLHLTLSRFQAQLDYLMESHEVVDLGSPANGTGVRPRVAITFDDAYRGALQLGLPELAARGMPATVFVAPGILGSAGCWWDVLASPGGGGLDRTIRDQAIETLRGDNDAIMDWAEKQGIPFQRLPSFAGIASEDELGKAVLTPGIRLAAHTWSHCNLAYLKETHRGQELTQPLAWLRQRFEHVLPWLAYPYGLFGRDTSSIARDAGYQRALRIEGGWVRDQALSDFVLPRFNVNSDLSVAGFILRASGLIPI